MTTIVDTPFGRIVSPTPKPGAISINPNRYRLLVVHPGASWSTHDVYVGLVRALLAQGHEIVAYPLDVRIMRASKWLDVCRADAAAVGREMPEPSGADIVFEASADIVNRAAYAEVDGVLLISSMYTPLQTLKALRWAHCPIGLLLTESPYDDEQQVKWAAEADVVWTNERTSVATFAAVNPQSYYLPAAYAPEIHTSEPQPGDDDVDAHDVVFVGTGFPERVALLEAVDWTGINLGLYGNWEGLPDASPLRPFVRGGVTDNATTAALYRRAKIGLNLYRTSKGVELGHGHITAGQAESLNPRAYEMAACGCLAISTFRMETVDVFATGLTFHAAAELAATIRLYLSLPIERNRIEMRDMESVHPHTFAARAGQLMAQFAPVLDRTLTAAYG